MKKNLPSIILGIIIVVLAVVIVYILTKHEHVFSEATCTTAPTCECGETNGEPLGHTYTEEITKEVKCTKDGLKTFTCECGDTYTETITATGHEFGEYVYNGDATVEEDGTQTATCSICEATDTQVAVGTKPNYTFTPMNETMYATQYTVIRSLPCVEGKSIIIGLWKGEEVEVIARCNETGWYQIKHKILEDELCYVSDLFLEKREDTTQNDKIAEEDFVTPEVPSGGSQVKNPLFNTEDGGDGGEIVGNVQIKPAGN